MIYPHIGRPEQDASGAWQARIIRAPGDEHLHRAPSKQRLETELAAIRKAAAMLLPSVPATSSIKPGSVRGPQHDRSMKCWRVFWDDGKSRQARFGSLDDAKAKREELDAATPAVRIDLAAIPRGFRGTPKGYHKIFRNMTVAIVDAVRAGDVASVATLRKATTAIKEISDAAMMVGGYVEMEDGLEAAQQYMADLNSARADDAAVPSALASPARSLAGGAGRRAAEN